MTIQIKYFASYRELTGKNDEELPAHSASTALDLWQTANPGLTIPENTLVAINMEYCALSHPVTDGDEVAFFPPVTGG